jgi:hypothetical protein
MFFLSCGALTRPFSLVFVKTLPKEERPSRKRKKEEYNKKRRERSGEFVKGRSSIYRKILGYYSTIHLPFYPHFTISPTHTITPTHTLHLPLHLPILLHLPLHLPILLHYPYTYPYYYITHYQHYYFIYHLLSHYSITTII